LERTYRLCLNERLDEEALRILVQAGLERCFPEPCRNWKHESTAVRNTCDTHAQREINSAITKLNKEQPALQRSLFEGLLDEVLQLYPTVNRGAFESPGGDTIKLYGPQPLSGLLKLYPKASDEFEKQVKAFQSINDQVFQASKNCITLFNELHSSLERGHIRLENHTADRMLAVVLDGHIEQSKANVRGNIWAGGGASGSKQSTTKVAVVENKVLCRVMKAS